MAKNLLQHVEGAEGVRAPEGAALKVVQHKLRSSLTRMLPEGFERHRVVKWPNCDCFCQSVQEDKFNCLLVSAFLVTLTLAMLSVIYYEELLFSQNAADSSLWEVVFANTWMILLLPVNVTVILGAIFWRKAMKKPQRRAKVQTISALVQQV